MLYDTHVHFDELLDGRSLDSALDEARSVRKIIAVGGSPSANRQAIELADTRPERIRAAVAYGRQRALCSDSLDELRDLLAEPDVVAVGETGIDLHYGADSEREQAALFREMLELARELSLPVIVHSRDAERLTVEMLSEHAGLWKGRSDGIGVLHCFTGTVNFAEALVKMGYFISFSGILTFRNAGLVRAAAAAVPEDRLLIETDSPYLAPEPHRGRRNEPAFLEHIARALAEIRGVDIEEIAGITTRNAERLFNEEGSRN